MTHMFASGGAEGDFGVEDINTLQNRNRHKRAGRPQLAISVSAGQTVPTKRVKPTYIAQGNLTLVFHKGVSWGSLWENWPNFPKGLTLAQPRA